LHADAPALAADIESSFEAWLAHNELGLALDELLDAADEAAPAMRRGFWEELLVAAMRMGTSNEFFRIAERIEGLEPHAFLAHSDPPRIHCDFNGFIERNVYSLNAVATALDFARLRCMPVPQQRVVLYDEVQQRDGSPGWLLADAVLVEIDRWGLVARANPRSFRRERPT
jgi:hypothetical protein